MLTYCTIRKANVSQASDSMLANIGIICPSQTLLQNEAYTVLCHAAQAPLIVANLLSTAVAGLRVTVVGGAKRRLLEVSRIRPLYCPVNAMIQGCTAPYISLQASNEMLELVHFGTS